MKVTIIRKATVSDAEALARCLLLAMEDIVYQLIGQQDSQNAFAFMRYFTGRDNNQYSWQNCWVAEADGHPIAAVNVYDGANLHTLRRPVINYIKMRFNRDISPEDETQAGEYYLDSFAVIPEHRCKGIGTELLQFVIDEYVIRRHHTLGLLVEESNATAKALYSRLGFERVGIKALLGKKLEHLQIIPAHRSGGDRSITY